MKKNLLFALLACIIPLLSYATVTVDGIVYTVSGTTATVAAQNSNGNGSISGDIVIPETITSGETTYTVTGLDKNAFYYCQAGITSITLPSTITTIGNYAFSWTDIENITIPSSVTSFGTYAFAYCKKLTGADLSALNITSLPNSTFTECTSLSDLSAVKLPEGVTSYGSSCFQDCAFETVEIPEGITSIGATCFASCSSLTTVVLPSTLTSIGNNAFQSCSKITSVTCKAVTPPSITFSFSAVGSDCVLYVPAESISAYSESAWVTSGEFSANNIVGLGDDGGIVLSHELTFDPADGETVYAPLSSVTITCAAGFNATGAASGVWVTPSSDYEGDAEYIGSAFEVSSDGTTCTLTFNQDITTPDTYRIHFPAGVFTLGDDRVESTETSIFITVEPAPDNNGTYELAWDPSGDESVETLTTITFSCPTGFYENHSAEWIIVYDEDGNKVTDGDSFEEGETEVHNGYFDTYTLTLTDAIYTAGTYTVKVPDKMFMFYESADYDDHYSEAFDIVYTVTGGDAPEEEDGTYFEMSLDPAENATVESLSTLTVKDGETENGAVNWEGHGTAVETITVTDEGGDVVAKGASYDYIDGTGDDAVGVTITFDTTITEEGTYTITIPAGLFSGYDSNGNYIENKATEYNVAVSGSESSEETSSDFILVPAAGDVVESISTLVVSAADGSDIDWEGSNTKVVNITVKDEDGNVVAKGSSASPAAKTVTITFDTTITDPGTYTIYIPAEYFGYNNSTTGDYIDIPETTYTVTVEGTVSYDITLDETELTAPVTSLTFYCEAGFQSTPTANGIYVSPSDDADFDDPVAIGSSCTIQDDNKYMVVALAQTISDAGDYHVLIHSGSCSLGSDKQDNAWTDLSFTVAEEVVEVSYDITLAETELTAPVTSLTFYCEAGFNSTPTASGIYVSTSDDTDFDDPVAIGSSCTIQDDNKYMVVDLAQTISDAGDYHVLIRSYACELGEDKQDNAWTDLAFTVTASSTGEETTTSTFVFTPADGAEVDYISTITITKGSDAGDDIEWNTSTTNVSNVTVTGTDGVVAKGTSVNDMSTGKIIIVLDNTITDAGTYTITIPASYVGYSLPDEEDNVEYIENEATTLTVTVSGNGMPEVDTNLYVTPADGAQLDELSTITVTCAAGIEPQVEDGTGLKVWDKYGSAAMQSYRTTTSDDGTTCTVQLLNLSTGTLTPLTADGYYTIDIPEGFFLVGEAGDENEQMEINITIGTPSDDENSNDASDYTFWPANGALVDYDSNGAHVSVMNNNAAFTGIYNTHQYPNATVTADDLKIYNSDGEIVAQGRGDRESYSVVDTHEVEFFTYLPTTNGSYTGVNITGFDPGEYTIYVPAGLIILSDGQTNPELTSTYTIRDTSNDPVFTTDPENHTSFTSLEYLTVNCDQTITVTGNVSQILVSSAKGDYTNTVSKYELSEDGLSCKLYFTTTINSTDMDTALEITIPGGFFSGQNEDIDITLFLGEAEEAVTPVLVFNPADDSTVTEIYQIVVSFEDNAPITYEYGLNDVTLTKDGEVVVQGLTGRPAVDSEDDPTSYTLTLNALVTAEEVDGVTLYDEGDYTLTLPAGMFFTGVANYNAEQSVTYHLVKSTSTGINGVNAATTDDATYFNLAGQRVNTPVKGQVYVVRAKDGTVKKVLK
ncbi:MAG: leucine-rich repeat domain-containing protein [Prevotella sp.]|nr:leucine-rich repeat domain-containing protein [Prevotella sp.]